MLKEKGYQILFNNSKDLPKKGKENRVFTATT